MKIFTYSKRAKEHSVTHGCAISFRQGSTMRDDKWENFTEIKIWVDGKNAGKLIVTNEGCFEQGIE